EVARDTRAPRARVQVDGVDLEGARLGVLVARRADAGEADRSGLVLRHEHGRVAGRPRSGPLTGPLLDVARRQGRGGPDPRVSTTPGGDVDTSDGFGVGRRCRADGHVLRCHHGFTFSPRGTRRNSRVRSFGSRSSGTTKAPASSAGGCLRECGRAASATRLRQRQAETLRVTLPALRQEVHTLTRLGVPPTIARTRWMFGFQRRLVRMWECETLCPKPGPLPQTSQLAATVS